MAAEGLYACVIRKIVYMFSVSNCKAHSANFDICCIRKNIIIIIKNIAPIVDLGDFLSLFYIIWREELGLC